MHRVYKTDMARAIWSGAISFGLVNVPVKLYSRDLAEDRSGSTSSRARPASHQQKRVDQSTGEEVPYEEIVKGYEITPDRYVMIEPEELDALDPKATKTIDIEEFVEPRWRSTRSTTTTPTTWRRPPAAPRPTGCCSTRCARRARSGSAGWCCAPSSSCARCGRPARC